MTDMSMAQRLAQALFNRRKVQEQQAQQGAETAKSNQMYGQPRPIPGQSAPVNPLGGAGPNSYPGGQGWAQPNMVGASFNLPQGGIQSIADRAKAAASPTQMGVSSANRPSTGPFGGPTIAQRFGEGFGAQRPQNSPVLGGGAMMGLMQGQRGGNFHNGLAARPQQPMGNVSSTIRDPRFQPAKIPSRTDMQPKPAVMGDEIIPADWKAKVKKQWDAVRAKVGGGQVSDAEMAAIARATRKRPDQVNEMDLSKYLQFLEEES